MSTARVQTSYADGSANTVRPQSVTYPNGRTVTFDYGPPGGMNDRCSRVAALVDDDDTVLAEYQYLGLGAVVQQDSPEPDLRMTLVSLDGANDPDTGDIYAGLDRFGRVKDVRWRNVGGDSDLSRVQYGYDRASNRTWRQNPTDAGAHHDWQYAYDGLHRLEDAVRGTLSLSGPQPSTLDPQQAQCWTLDATGNWRAFRQADAGGGSPWDLVQQRLGSPVNEILGIENTVGSPWAQPAYDAAGNMTTIPQPHDPAERYTATYDGWNRLVKLVDTTTEETVQENQYDARTFRTVTKSYAGGTLAETRHAYYSDGWRCLEERLGTSPDAAGADRQLVWGRRYIDDLVLRDRTTTGPLDERLYALQDGNWNVTAVVDDGGTVQERYEYDPYGTLRVLDDDFDPRGASSFDWETTYCGYRFDALTGLYPVRFRVLIPLLGWAQRDPLGYVDSMSLYEPVTSSPLSNADPFGLALYHVVCTILPTINQLATLFPQVSVSTPFFTTSPTPCPGGSTPRFLPLTLDEYITVRACQGNPACEAELATILNIYWSTWSSQTLTQRLNPCANLQMSFADAIQNVPLASISVGSQYWSVIPNGMRPRLATGHLATTLTFPSGGVVYLDAGITAYAQGNLGGADLIFLPSNVPWNYIGFDDAGEAWW